MEDTSPSEDINKWSSFNEATESRQFSFIRFSPNDNFSDFSQEVLRFVKTLKTNSWFVFQ